MCWFFVCVVKMFDVVLVLCECIVFVCLCDVVNIVECKDFCKGMLFINIVGFVVNLVEVFVCYVYGDEIDCWVCDFNNEGDFIGIVEKCVSIFGCNVKFYYLSLFIIDGVLCIVELYVQSDQCCYYVFCLYCGYEYIFEFEQLCVSDDLSDVYCECFVCFYKICEYEKFVFYKIGCWIVYGQGDGEIVGFYLLMMYVLFGWVFWCVFVKEYCEVKLVMEKGDLGLMQVFYNMCFVCLWDNVQQCISVDELCDCVEDYCLCIVFVGVLLFIVVVDM